MALHETPIGTLIPGIVYRPDIRACDLYSLKDTHGKQTWGEVLISCIESQAKFLCAVWSQKFPIDDTVTIVFQVLCRRGMFLEVADVNNLNHKDVFMAAHECFTVGNEIGRLQVPKSRRR